MGFSTEYGDENDGFIHARKLNIYNCGYRRKKKKAQRRCNIIRSMTGEQLLAERLFMPMLIVNDKIYYDKNILFN